MRRYNLIALLGAGIVTVGMLSALTTSSVFINGKKTTEFLVSNDKLYVSVDALKEAGASITVAEQRVSIQFIPAAGLAQVDAIEGIIGEWLSNGTWRVRVSDIKEVANPFFGKGKGYSVKLEVRNIAQQPRAFFEGLELIQMYDEAGNQLRVAASGKGYNSVYTKLAPADGFSAEIQFGYEKAGFDPNSKPEKLLILYRSSGGKPALPHFRIFLNPDTQAQSSQPAK